MDFVQIVSNPVFQAAILAAASYGSWKNRQRIAKILHESPEPQVRDFVAEIRAATEQEARRGQEINQTPKAPATLAVAPAATPAAPGLATGTPAKPFVFVEAQTNVQTVKLSTVAKADNLLVVGQKGAGKTTLLQKVLATRLSDEMAALDPHSKPGKWPCPTIGAGRDYPTIGRALVSIEARMDERFKQLASGEIAEGVFPRRSVVTDEYRSIADKLNGRNGTVDAGSLLLNRISEGRKVNETVLVACHNDTGEALGISGNTDMKTCFDWIIYMGGLVDSLRTSKCPSETKVEALKRERPALAWLTEKNQWFLLEDDLPMPDVSSVSRVVSTGSQEPVPVEAPKNTGSELGNQFGTSTEPVPGTDGIDAEAIKALHSIGWSRNKIAERMKGRREDRLARIRQALGDIEQDSALNLVNE